MRPAIDVALSFPSSGGVAFSITILPHKPKLQLIAKDDAEQARAVMDAIEATERRVAAERMAVEQQVELAAALAENAEHASAEWVRATQLAARGAASRLADSPERRQSGARMLAATAKAFDVQLADAKEAAAAAAAAEAEAIRAANATPWSNGFVLVSEQGLPFLSEGSYQVQRFGRERPAREVAATLWCCWVLYREVDTCGYEELASGGLGFAQHAIRAYVRQHMERPKRAARRVSRGGDVMTLS